MTPRDPLPTIRFDVRARLAGMFLIDHMVRTGEEFGMPLTAETRPLNGVLTWLHQKQLLELVDRKTYRPTAAGEAEAAMFRDEFTAYLDNNAVFSGVDLAEGVFAFESGDVTTPPETWREILEQERWEDLRLAVAEYRNEDPVPIVFMGLVREGRFGRGPQGEWDHDRLLGTVWDEIRDICDTALSWKDLGWEDEFGEVTAEDVIKDVIATAEAVTDGGD